MSNLRKFQVATEDEIKNAETTDVYFTRTKEILEKEGLSDLHVTAEITTGSLPRNWEWGILAGVEEAAICKECLGLCNDIIGPPGNDDTV